MKIEEINQKENEAKLIEILESHQQETKGFRPEGKRDFSYAMMDGERYVGGITGNVFMNTMHVGLLGVENDFRGQGIGDQLLKIAENIAVELDCRYVTIHTQDYQALDYYQKRAYKVFGKLPDAPFENTTKYYLFKKLNT